MKIYDIIADNYSDIFPPDQNRFNFLKNVIQSSNPRILDTGCATGDIAIRLAESGYDVTGIDLNSRMIEIAKNKIYQSDFKINFQTMNMLDISDLGKFDLLLCFGNTLPHLQSETECSNFFKIVKNCIHYKGKFIFQILNYDKILKDGKINFQIIENDKFMFRRNYNFLSNGQIMFTIEFEDKKTGETLSDSTSLMPFKQSLLKNLLKKNDFKTIDIYSDYNLHKSDLNEYSSIYIAE